MTRAEICQHGQKIGAQGGIVAGEIAAHQAAGIDSELLLAFYSACDCCDTLMHHSAVGYGYFVMSDGRTLCHACAVTEKAECFDGASPFDKAGL